jgi:AmiR/NasT family two-component response regulator
LLQERNVRRREAMAEQPQAALNSRVVIEQAQGQARRAPWRGHDQAFRLLRQHARNTNQRLTDIARQLINSLPTATFPLPDC